MGEKGFTLIEMLLVVAIIGFLVAILLPAVGGYGSDAKEKAVKADLRTLKSAIEVYYISHGAYPPASGAGAWGNSACYMLTAATNGYYRFIDQFPDDPYNTSGSYGYLLSTNGNYYVIWSQKEAGTPTIADTDDVDMSGISLYATNVRVITP